MSTNDIHSMVIASDYRVPDPTKVWPLLERNKAALADIGAHHILVYTSTHDYGRVLVMIGVHSREPIVELLRSRIFFDWFDAVGNLPPQRDAGRCVLGAHENKSRRLTKSPGCHQTVMAFHYQVVYYHRQLESGKG